MCFGIQSFNLLRAMGSVCQNDRVHRTAHALKDRYDIVGGLPDTIEDDWIESEEKLEEMMDEYIHLDPDKDRWELAGAVAAGCR